MYIGLLDGGRRASREGQARSEEGRGMGEGAREGGGWGTRRERETGREGARGGREEAMMLGRQRASVDEERVDGGMVDEGNERVRDGTKYGRREGGSGRRRD